MRPWIRKKKNKKPLSIAAMWQQHPAVRRVFVSAFETRKAHGVKDVIDELSRWPISGRFMQERKVASGLRVFISTMAKPWQVMELELRQVRGLLTLLAYYAAESMREAPVLVSEEIEELDIVIVPCCDKLLFGDHVCRVDGG
jgi:hypothetical protein